MNSSSLSGSIEEQVWLDAAMQSTELEVPEGAEKPRCCLPYVEIYSLRVPAIRPKRSELQLSAFPAGGLCGIGAN